jgi:large subunit ribosomal protein L25
MIVDWQHEPVKGALLHIDLKRIAMDKAMRVSVPIQLIGVPVGVKTQGGILEHVLREVEIECLPSDIPGHLDVDVSALEINGSSTSPTCRTLARSSSCRRGLDRRPRRRDQGRGCGA